MRSSRRALPALLLSLLLAYPATAGAASLSKDQWEALYADVGPLVMFPMLGLHYARRWEAYSAGTELLAVDIVQHQPHWQTYFTGDLPPGFLAPAAWGWAGVSKRVRLGGVVRTTPQLDMTGAGAGIAVQILDGTAEDGAFFAGAGLHYAQTPRFRMTVPSLNVEWSDEVLRTQGNQRAPWVFYYGVRLDAGVRFATNVRGSDATFNADFTHPLIRGTVRVRRRHLQVAYGFGGQRGRTLTHTLGLTWFVSPVGMD